MDKTDKEIISMYMSEMKFYTTRPDKQFEVQGLVEWVYFHEDGTVEELDLLSWVLFPSKVNIAYL